MIKKAGIITVGVAAGLMAAAPFASAGEAPQHAEHHGSGSDCTFTGGSAGHAGSGDAAGAIAATGLNAGGIGGSNVGNIADCSSFLNDNVNGNQVLSNNAFAL